jgi:hypothetical protein
MMALWKVTKAPSASPFDEVVPAEVLSEFDALLTFTFRDRERRLTLAHLCAIGAGVSRYLAVRTDAPTVADLKSGVLSIRGAITRDQIWLIDVSANRNVINAWTMMPDELPSGALPDQDVLLFPELEEIQASDPNLARFARSGSDGHVSIDGGPVEDHTIDAGFYGSFCKKADELFAAICQSLGITKPALRLGMTMESSYAVDLIVSQPIDPQEMFFQGPPDITKNREAFDHLMSMIADKQPAGDATKMIKLEYPIRQRLGEVLELIAKNGAVVSVRTRASPLPRKLSSMQAQDRLKAVRDLGYPFRFLDIVGRLIGGFVEKSGKQDRSFCIRVEEPGKKAQDFRGTISEDAVPKMLSVRLGDQVEANLQIETEGENQSYTMLDIRPVDESVAHSIS